MDKLRIELAIYLCEDESAFKLDECIKVFGTFCDKFNRAVKVLYTYVYVCVYVCVIFKKTFILYKNRPISILRLILFAIWKICWYAEN